MSGYNLTSIQPRVLTAPAVARYLGRSPTWFNLHLPELVARGFPLRVPIINGWDRAAIDAWLAGQNSRQPLFETKDSGKRWEGTARG